jgi:hypothetical protein
MMFKTIAATIVIGGGLLLAPTTHADDDCRTGGACNYDGWQHGGCYDGALNWVTDLPCIDRFGNWRGIPAGDPIPPWPPGYIIGRPMGGFGAHPHLDPRMAPLMPGGGGFRPGMPGMPGRPEIPQMPRGPMGPMGPMGPHGCMPYFGCH